MAQWFEKELKKPFYTVFILENLYENGLIAYLESLLVEIIIYPVNDTVNSVAFRETKLNFTCNSTSAELNDFPYI